MKPLRLVGDRPFRKVIENKRCAPLVLSCPCGTGQLTGDVYLWLTEDYEILIYGTCNTCRTFRSFRKKLNELVAMCPKPMIH